MVYGRWSDSGRRNGANYAACNYAQSDFLGSADDAISADGVVFFLITTRVSRTRRDKAQNGDHYGMTASVSK